MNAKAPQDPPTAEELAVMGGKPHPSPPPPLPYPSRDDVIGIARRAIEKGGTFLLPVGWTCYAANRVWVSMQVIAGPDENHFELIGVFTTEAKAVAACREPTDCVAPVELDAVAPRETTVMTGAYYPLA